MKSILLKITMGLLVVGTISACSSTQTQEEQTSKEYTSAYICPMHCEGSGSDSAGTCPTCQMDYVKNTTTNN